MSWPFSFERPEWLWLLLTIPVVVAVSLRTLRGIEKPRRIAAIALRCAVITVLAAALARIQWVKRSDRVAVMFVLDRSRSIPEDLQKQAQGYIRELARSIRTDDRVGVIGFDGEAALDVIPSRVGFDIVGFGMASQPDRTDLSAGLRMAMAAFPEGYSRRIVVISDGNENIGDLGSEVDAASASKVSIDVVPLEYQHKNEIMFDRIVVPAQAGKDTRVPVRLLVKSQRPTRARLTLEHGGIKVAEQEVSLTGGMRPDPFTVPIELHSGGVHRFDARITALAEGSDSIVENNQATAFTFVDAQGRLLILTQPGADDDRVLAEALAREKIDVEMASVDEVPIDLLKLQEYGVVVLANIPADTFTSEQHKALASYVRDFGGGLIMTGGDQSFGAGGWIGTPIEEVSPVNFEIKHKRKIPRGALAIVMHSCELPRGNYWGEQVAIAAISSLSSLDYLGVIAYAWDKRGANWEVPLDVLRNKAAVINKVKQMKIGDMPDFDSTMRIAATDLMALKDASQRHMIIISDGDPSPPAPGLIQMMKDNRITCSTVGIGYGVHVMDAQLSQIAKDTGGRFYQAKNPRKLPQIFVKEARVVKRALLDNREFQPNLTTAFDDLLAGIGASELPPLGGLVLTERKADAQVPMIRQGTDAGDPVEDPVLAYWNFEMGKMAVFTSGWWPKWGDAWADWAKFGKFWAQVMQWAMRQAGSAHFDIVTRLEGNQGRVVIEALNKDASYLNFLQIRGKLVTPSMDDKPLYLTQTGPGRYEATFDVNDHGNYLVNLQYSDPDNESGLIRTGLSVPYSPEFRELGTNFALLERAAEKTSGRRLEMNPEKDEVFARNLPPAVARYPMWRWFVQWILLPLFLLDVASRRLASSVAMSIYVEIAVLVFMLALLYQPAASTIGTINRVLLAIVVAEIVGWGVRWRSIMPAIRFFTAGVTALSRAGQRSQKALSQLKGVREKVREEIQQEAAPLAEKPRTIELEPLADRKRRFDVGDKRAAEPAADLTESLGGAQAEPASEQRKPARPGPGQAGGGPGDLASRLRRAKQRAQDSIRDKKDDGKKPKNGAD